MKDTLAPRFQPLRLCAHWSPVMVRRVSGIVPLLCALLSVMFLAAPAGNAAQIAGWTTVGDDAPNNPKYVFDVPPQFAVEKAASINLPTSDPKKHVSVSLAVATSRSRCPGWQRAISFIETLKPGQNVSLKLTPDYARKIFAQRFTAAHLSPPLRVSKVANFNLAGQKAQRIDASANFPASPVTCSARSAKATFITIAGQYSFVLLRDTSGAGSVPEATANQIISTLRRG